ncbi:MAG: prolipoprotein diacylglyceryl transferase [Spirochaetales bacterium]|nr:prolipoprotein diacylglyceryl transferase [Spirochaetales bacterium]
MPLYIEHPTWLTPEIIPGVEFLSFLRWYGLMYIVAFAVTYVLFRYQIKKRELEVDTDTVTSFFFWGIIGIVAGARVFYMLFFDREGTVWTAPWTLILPFDKNWQFSGFRGMNYYGGIVGGVVALVIYAYRKKIDILDWGDMLIVGVPLAHTFGRIGNFINGELYGRLTDAPWGMVFRGWDALADTSRKPLDPEIERIANATGIAITGDQTALPRHPTQIYSMIFECLAIFAIMWFVFRKKKPYKGFLIGLYIALYGIARFVLDYFRVPLRDQFLIELGPQHTSTDLLLSPWNLSLDNVFSLLTFLGGVIAMAGLYFWHKRNSPGEIDHTRGEMRKLRKKID